MDSQTAYEAFELRLRIAEAEREMNDLNSSAKYRIPRGVAEKICELAHFLYYAYDRYLKMTGINLRPPVEEDSY